MRGVQGAEQQAVPFEDTLLSDVCKVLKLCDPTWAFLHNLDSGEILKHFEGK